LPQLVIALGEASLFHAIQVGYPDGDFYCQTVEIDGSERMFLSPGGGAFLVVDIVSDKPNRRF